MYSVYEKIAVKIVTVILQNIFPDKIPQCVLFRETIHFNCCDCMVFFAVYKQRSKLYEKIFNQSLNLSTPL